MSIPDYCHKMNFFTSASSIKAKKVVVIPPLFNNDQRLEFKIQPENNLFYPNEVFLHFNCKIPAEYLLDNDCSKLFDSIEVTINGCQVSNRTSSNEHFITSYFTTMSNYPTDIIETSMRPMGYFSVRDYDVSEYNAMSSTNKAKILRERSHYEIVESGNVTFRVYNIITPIQSPLFQQNKPLPSNMTINLILKRSKPEISLLQLASDSKNTFESSNVELTNAFLECTYVESEALNKKYSFHNSINALKYPIEEPVIRTFTIDSDLNTATFSANTGGKLPFMIFSTLITPEAFFGSKELSTTKFERNDLTSFQVLVDNTELPGSKVKISDESFVEPYVAFLRNTKLYNNALAGKTLRMGDFERGNFILSYDLTTCSQESGWLTLKYDFNKYLPQKLMAIVYMIYEKEIIINKDREVDIVNN